MKLPTKFAKWKRYILFIILLITVAFSWQVYFFHHNNDYDCSATLRVESGPSDFDASFKIFLLMQGNNTGHFDVSGLAMLNKKKYNVQRSYHFNYARKENDIYHLTNITISKRDADNVIEGMMQKVFFSPNQDVGRYIKIQKLKNAWIIQNPHSPSLICVSN